jgi:hypothetical protein
MTSSAGELGAEADVVMDGIRTVALRHRYARSFLGDEGKYVGRVMASLIVTISGNYSGVQAEG